MHEPFDMMTIVFAILAVFVIWKLSSVLGMRTGHEKPKADPFRRPGDEAARRDAPEREGNVIRLPGAANDDRRAPAPDAGRWAGFAEPASPLWAELDALARLDAAFSPRSFLDGAKSAYEMIVIAFAKGDKVMLQNLLAEEVYASFAQAISERESRGETAETTLVSIDKANLDHVVMQGTVARVSVAFAAKLISVTRDKAGITVDGSADKVIVANDLWTFARDTNSRDPNWKLVATETRH